MRPDPPAEAAVAVHLDRAGTSSFEVALRDVGSRMVVMFRGEPVSAPTIQPEQRGDGLVVTGLTSAEADELVRRLSR
jgi:preprotein translocase subunit SecD